MSGQVGSAPGVQELCTPANIVPENNLNIHIKTEPVKPGADATVYVWFLHVGHVNQALKHTHTVH